jgi:carboxyl-terminal processing protease
MDPEEYQELQSDTEGAFGGLGLEVTLRDNYVTVVTPMDDTPGFRAGILAGDRILKINGRSADKLALTDAVKLLRGDPGTRVTVTVQRPSTGVTRELTMTRAIINVDMVKDINSKKEFPLGPDQIGYIRITQFGDNTSDELEDGLKKLKAQGMKALVLDLRGNPGGLLDEAVGVCSKFLPRGQLVVTTEGRDPDQNATRRADGHGDELNGMPVVVLVNLGSASASEIVTGCLQDLHRGIVLGEKTFGKDSGRTHQDRKNPGRADGSRRGPAQGHSPLQPIFKSREGRGEIKRPVEPLKVSQLNRRSGFRHPAVRDALFDFQEFAAPGRGAATIHRDGSRNFFDSLRFNLP